MVNVPVGKFKVEPPPGGLTWLRNSCYWFLVIIFEATRVAWTAEYFAERTQATNHGDYLFVWMKIGPTTQCRAPPCAGTVNLTGTTSFEPLLRARRSSENFMGLCPKT